jgi:uncharacterized membrane protein
LGAVWALEGDGMLLAFPWLFLSFGLYNVLAFARGSAVSPQDPFNEPIASFKMVSGAIWQASAGDILIALTLVFLFFEILKAARTGSVAIVDHVLSIVLFALCLVEFLVRREAATSVFFIITLVTFIDVIAGFALTITRAPRNFTAAR